MKKIYLTQGKFALVDDEDYWSLNSYKWCYSHGYAYRKTLKRQGAKTVYMHRQIMGFPKEIIDHKDRNTLNNQRNNLRLCSREGLNLANTKEHSNNISGYRGVHFDKTRNLWKAEIRVYNITIFLGRFKTPELAAVVYDIAAIKHFGEFAVMNTLKKFVKVYGGCRKTTFRDK